MTASDGKPNGKIGRNEKGQFTSKNNGGRWKPGESGNPLGRKPGKNLQDWLLEIGAEIAVEGKDNVPILDPETGRMVTKLERLSRYLFTEAFAGNMTATAMILDRIAPVNRSGSVLAGSTIHITIQKGAPPTKFVESHEPAPPQIEGTANADEQ